MSNPGIPTFDVGVPASTGASNWGDGGASVDQANAGTWSKLSGQLAEWAGEAVKADAKKAGEQAGQDENFRPGLSLGTRSTAFNDAAVSAYASQLDVKTRTAINSAYDAWDNLPADQKTPKALQDNLAKLRGDMQKHDVFPEVAGKFANNFDTYSLAYMRAAQGDYDKRQQDQAKAALIVDQNSAADTMHRMATLGTPEADQALAKTQADYGAKIDAAVQDGTLTAVQAQKMKDDLRTGVMQTRIQSGFDKAPDKAKFLENFKSSYGAGVGAGAKNIVYKGPLDSATNGPAPAQMYDYLISKGASRNEALMLTGAAASESGLNPRVTHDGGIGLGLFGHNGARLAAMKADAGTAAPDWRAQASFALKELRSRPESALVAAAKSPEDLAAAQMHFEQPAGYTKNSPQAGDNYTGRLNTIRRFAALGGGKEVAQSDNPTAGLDNDSYDRLVRYMDHGVRAEASQAKAVQGQQLTEIKDATKLIVGGMDVGPGPWNALQDKYAVSPDPDVRAAFAQAGRTRDMLLGFKGRPPEEIEATISAMRAQVANGGTEDQKDLIKVADDYHKKLVKDRSTDPIGRAAADGMIAAPAPLDFSAPDKFAASLAARAGVAQQAASNLSLPAPVYLRPDEKAQLKTIAAEGGPRMVQTAGAMAAALGPRLDGALREMGGEAPKFAYAARLAAMGGAKGFLDDFGAWQSLTRDPSTAKAMALPEKNAADTIERKIYGDALAAVPQLGAGAITAARQAFEVRALRDGWDRKITGSDAQAAYERTLQEAVGAHFDGPTQYGGVAKTGGWWSSQHLLAPPDMRADRLGAAIGSLTDADLKALPAAPVYGDGKTPVPAEAVRAGRFVSIAPGRYRVALGDPKGADPKWLQTGDGRPFVLDLPSISDRLRARMPDAFLGASGAPSRSAPAQPLAAATP